MPECQLIQGTFALFIQFILGSLCIGTLVIKRLTETPPRPWNIWFFDALKQGIGATFGHFANIVLSVLLVSNIDSHPVDECQWYCLSYLVDSTIGITMNLLLLTAFEWILRHQPNCSHLKFGDYGDPPSIRLFAAQLMVWLTIVLFTKIVTYSLQLHYSLQFQALMAYLLSGVSEDPKLELVVVMIIIPMIVNSLQFWLTDMFLKNDSNNNASETSTLAGGRRTSLSRQSSGSRRSGHVALAVEMSPVEESLLRSSRSSRSPGGLELEANDTSPLRPGTISSSSGGGYDDDNHAYSPLHSTLGSRVTDSGTRGASASWYQQPFQFLSLLDNIFSRSSSSSAPLSSSSTNTRRGGPKHLKYAAVDQGVSVDRELRSATDAFLADSMDSNDSDTPLSTTGIRLGLGRYKSSGGENIQQQSTGSLLESKKHIVSYNPTTVGTGGSTQALRSRHNSRDALLVTQESTTSPLHTASSSSAMSTSQSGSSGSVTGGASGVGMQGHGSSSNSNSSGVGVSLGISRVNDTKLP